MDTNNLSSAIQDAQADQAAHKPQDTSVMNNSAFRWVPIAPELADETRPMPEITAEIIQGMDNLCNWLHEVQRVHSAMSKLRAERREAARNAAALEQAQAATDCLSTL